MSVSKARAPVAWAPVAGKTPTRAATSSLVTATAADVAEVMAVDSRLEERDDDLLIILGDSCWHALSDDWGEGDSTVSWDKETNVSIKTNFFSENTVQVSD